MENTAVPGSPRELKLICCSVSSEGGNDPHGIRRSTNSGTTANTVTTTTIEPLLSIRLDNLDKGSTILPLGVTVFSSNNAAMVFEVRIGGTLTSPTWESPGDNDLVPATARFERDVAATAITGGEVIHSGYIETRAAIQFSFEDMLPLTKDINGERSILSICAAKVSGGTNPTAFAAVHFREIP